MRKLHVVTGTLLALAISAHSHGQPSNPAFIPVSSNPAGNACTGPAPQLWYLGTYYGCDGTGHYAAVGASAVPVTYWNRLGTVFSPRADLAADQQWVYEPQVIYEPPTTTVLSNVSVADVFEFVFTCGSGTGNLCYGESVDGFFGARGTPMAGIGANPQHSCWMHDGSTYRLFASISGNSIVEYTSASPNNGYTSAGTAIALGAGGQWDASSLGNCSISKVSGTYYLFYDGNSGGSGACSGSWCEGYATGTDGVTFTKQGKIIDYGNTVAWGGGSHPDVHYIPSLTATPWVMFFHSFQSSYASDIWMATATAPGGPWSSTPYFVMRRHGPDEGEPSYPILANPGGLSNVPQIADARVLEITDSHATTLCPGTCTWMFYDANAQSATANEFHIKAAFTPQPLASTVTAIINGTLLSSTLGDRSVQVSYDWQGGHYYSILPFYQMTRTTTNTDLAGKLTFSGTTASYNFAGLYGVAPLCFIQPINPTGTLTYKVTTLSTSTLTITASGSSTDTVAYQCVGQY